MGATKSFNISKPFSQTHPPRENTPTRAHKGRMANLTPPSVNKDSGIFYPCRLACARWQIMTRDHHLHRNELVPRWKLQTKFLPGHVGVLNSSVYVGSCQAAIYLFPSKDVLVEVELDLLVGDVDAQLLKGVFLEVFKTKDVQDADVKAFVILPRQDDMQ